MYKKYTFTLFMFTDKRFSTESKFPDFVERGVKLDYIKTPLKTTTFFLHFLNQIYNLYTRTDSSTMWKLYKTKFIVFGFLIKKILFCPVLFGSFFLFFIVIFAFRMPLFIHICAFFAVCMQIISSRTTVFRMRQFNSFCDITVNVAAGI